MNDVKKKASSTKQKAGVKKRPTTCKLKPAPKKSSTKKPLRWSNNTWKRYPAKKKKQTTTQRVVRAVSSGARAAGKGVVDYFDWVDRQNSRHDSRWSGKVALDEDGEEYVWYKGRWVHPSELPDKTSSRYMPYPQSSYPVVIGDTFDLDEDGNDDVIIIREPSRRSRRVIEEADDDDMDEAEDLLDDSPRSWHKELQRNSRRVARRNDAGSIMSAGVDDIMNVGYGIL